MDELYDLYFIIVDGYDIKIEEIQYLEDLTIDNRMDGISEGKKTRIQVKGNCSIFVPTDIRSVRNKIKSNLRKIQKMP